MALQFNLESTQFGIPAPQAYLKIASFVGTKDQIQVQVAIYFNEDARQNDMTTIHDANHQIAIDDLKGDLLPAIYAVLKTLSAYEGAEDI
jgi:hypothetical protein